MTLSQLTAMTIAFALAGILTGLWIMAIPEILAAIFCGKC